MKTITLYIPHIGAALHHIQDSSQYPVLIWLLSKAKQKPLVHHAMSANLYQLFEFPKTCNGHAAIYYYSDYQEKTMDYWLLAEPVHLYANLDQLILLNKNDFSLSQQEADTFLPELNDLLAHDNLNICLRDPYRWYIKLPAPINIQTTPTDQVCHQNIRDFLPTGIDATIWIKRLNEIQMLLTDHPTNRQRKQQGQLSINSLWFWGAGRLPTDNISSKWDYVISDDSVVKGFCQLSDTPYHHLPSSLVDMPLVENGNHLIIMTEADLSLTHLEDHWLQPLKQYLDEHKIHAVNIMTDNKRYELNSYSSWCFWRRPKLSSIL